MKNKYISCFKTLRCCIHPAYNCWHFNIYEQDKFHAQFHDQLSYNIASCFVICGFFFKIGAPDKLSGQ